MDSKKYMGLVAAIVLFLSGLARAADQTVLNSQTDKENYAMGVRIVREMMQKGGVVNLDIVIRGMQDSLKGDQLLMTEGEIGKIDSARASGPEKETPMQAAEDSKAQKEKDNSGSNNARKPEPVEHAPRLGPQFAQDAPRTPSGSALSRRNEARMTINDLKKEMRARALAGDI
jgi:hypothetical protein